MNAFKSNHIRENQFQKSRIQFRKRILKILFSRTTLSITVCVTQGPRRETELQNQQDM